MATDISASQYATKARRLMKIAQSLRDIGAQADIDVPKIAVIGGQSAGKSSLVEAIRVPRDSGTCTRCPMEVNLISEPGPWYCQVTLRFEYDSVGQFLGKILRIPFGPPLSDKGDVELTLRRAQAATLNHPNEDPELFLTKSRDELQYYRTPHAFSSGTLKFSKNVVCIDIYDEQNADLSFVDLPGLIQNDEPQTVKFVEDLVKSSIIGNCLILVTIPMSDDMENQRAMRLAQEVDEAKNRTIGVLTKPDTLTAGATSARQKWLDLVMGQGQSDHDSNHTLRLGYYCVKLADEAERKNNPTRVDRGLHETAFFSTTSPWNEVINRDKFGIQNLVTDLSRHLTNLLDIVLPSLREQAESQLKAGFRVLAELPPPLETDPNTEVLRHVTDFSQDIAAMVHGSDSVQWSQPHNRSSPHVPRGPDVGVRPGGKSFIQQNRATYESFKQKIRSTEPDFRPFEDHTSYTKPDYPKGDYETEELIESGDNPNPRDLSYVRRLIKGSLSWELPNNIPFSAKSALISEFTCLWDAPAAQCFEAVAKLLESSLYSVIEKHFNRFPRLHRHMIMLIMNLLARQKEAARVVVDSVLGLEGFPLYTQNDHYLATTRKKWLSLYMDVRKNKADYGEAVSGAPLPTYVYEEEEEEEEKREGTWAKAKPRPSWTGSPAEVLRSATKPPLERALLALHELGYPGLTPADLTRLCKPDPFEEELEVMADVRAYFQVAYKRIIDYVPLTIEHALNQALAGSMKTTLLQELRLGERDASDRLAALLAEDPDVAHKRVELNARLGRLEKVQVELRGFGV